MELYVPGGGFESSECSRSGGEVLIVVLRVRDAAIERAARPPNSLQNGKLKHTTISQCMK